MNRIFRNLDEFEIISPNVVGTDTSDDIVFTTRAMEKIVTELNNDYSSIVIDDTSKSKTYFVRLTMLSSPSHSKTYSIQFDYRLNDFDRVFTLRKIQIVIDRKSIFYFMGTLIDYIDNEDGKGFIFLNSSDDDLDEYLVANGLISTENV
jgi:Fe-S cluster assembly iron-binding protein IscA